MFVCASPTAVGWPAAPVYGASSEQPPMVAPSSPMFAGAGELSLATRLASVTLALSARYGPTLGLVQVRLGVAGGRGSWAAPAFFFPCSRRRTNSACRANAGPAGPPPGTHIGNPRGLRERRPFPADLPRSFSGPAVKAQAGKKVPRRDLYLLQTQSGAPPPGPPRFAGLAQHAGSQPGLPGEAGVGRGGGRADAGGSGARQAAGALPRGQVRWGCVDRCAVLGRGSAV